jgi:gliding motility-associated-like protein
MPLKKLPYLIVFLILMTPSVFWAKHIVGGEITYKLKSKSSSSNNYVFTMRIYRDCNSVQGAPFDEIASIGAYLKSTVPRLAARTSAPLGSIQAVTAPKIECLIPPNICVEEGVYTWEMNLPVVPETYIILYQRCCRNESISNINLPGQVGASYAVEITNAAQVRGNDSPTFKSFPPTVICSNYPLNFDHSAVDADGDILRYSFCEPYTGGGQIGGNGCAMTSPNPPCWPPAGSITYKSGYSALKPVGGNPLISIDLMKGIITGTPTENGQYVVSVCVEEFTADGRLLGVLKRDFQFNVAPCDPIIQASVKADTVIDKTYFINTCGEKFVKIANKSLDRRFVTDFKFDVLISDENKIFKDWEPTIVFPDTGVYRGRLFLNPGTICADTIKLQYNVFNTVIPNFSFTYDTCVAGPINFRDTSFAPNGRIVSWNWDFGDGKKANIKNPTHLYELPGTKKIKMFVKDNVGCQKDTVREIRWYPVPPLLLIQPSSFTGCTPAKVTFKNLSSPIDSTYDIKWNFGDGGTSKVITPTYTYEKPGNYSVNLEITSPVGCKTGKNFNDWIKISQGAKANFAFSPERVTKAQSTVSFFDKSLVTTGWQWNFANQGYSTRQNPSFTFRDTGLQKVKLLVTNQFGCTDTMVQFIDVIPVASYFLPNAFTPNDDAENDVYKGNGIVDGVKNFNMKIWNRWGELIFETTNPLQGWNGRKNNSGSDSPQGIYLCIVTYKTPRDEDVELRSYANLIR